MFYGTRLLHHNSQGQMFYLFGHDKTSIEFCDDWQVIKFMSA